MSKAQEYQQRDILSLTDKIKLLSKEKSDLESSIRGLKEQERIERENLQNKFGGTLASLTASLQKAKADLEAVNTEIKHRTEDRDKLVANHKTISDAHFEKMSKAKNELAAHKVNIELAKEEVATHERHIKSLKDEIESLLKRKAELLEDIRKAVEEGQVALKKLSDLRVKIKTAEDKLVRLEKDIARISKRKEVLVEDVLTQKAQIAHERYQKHVGMNEALDHQILQKRKTLGHAK